jgi:hypothetical protein
VQSGAVRGHDHIVVAFTTTCAIRGCRGRDRMVIGFTITCAISAYHH